MKNSQNLRNFCRSESIGDFATWTGLGGMLQNVGSSGKGTFLSPHLPHLPVLSAIAAAMLGIWETGTNKSSPEATVLKLESRSPYSWSLTWLTATTANCS